MPVFDFTGPDGHTYTVTGPDGATPEQAFAILQKQLGSNMPAASPQNNAPQSTGGSLATPAQQSNGGQPNTATDIAKGAVRGLATGAEGLAGLPGDLESAVKWGLDKILPLPPDAQTGGLIPPPPTTSQIDSVIGASKLPDPQTQWGQRAQSVASFLPGAVAGPESLAKNLVQAGAAGAASEAAGEANKGTSLELPARVLGAMVAPSSLGKVGAALPTTEQLVAAGSKGFNDFRGLPFAVRDGVMNDWAKQTLNDFATDDRGFRSQLTPQTTSLLQDYASRNGATWADDLDVLKEQLKDVANNGSLRDPLAANAALSSLNGRISGANQFTPAETLLGDPDEAAQTWSNANANYAAGMRSQAVNDALNTASVNADAANSGANIGNATRQQFKKFLVNDAAARGFSPDELAQANRVVRGTIPGNALRAVSNALGGGGGIMQGLAVGAGGYLGSQSGEPGGTAAGAVLPMILGVLARRGANASVLRQATTLDQMTRLRSPLAQAAGAINPTSLQGLAFVRRLLNWRAAIKVRRRIASRADVPEPDGVASS
jgi:hypothetical protein